MTHWLTDCFITDYMVEYLCVCLKDDWRSNNSLCVCGKVKVLCSSIVEIGTFLHFSQLLRRVMFKVN